MPIEMNRIEFQETLVSARSIHLVGSVNPDTLEKTLAKIIEYNATDNKAPIILYLTTPGGNIPIGNAFIDYIMYLLEAPLFTVALGEVCSMGIPIFLTGTRRFVGPRTQFFFHENTARFGKESLKNNSLQQVVDRLKWEYDTNTQFVVDRCEREEVTYKLVDEWQRNETALLAVHALEFGLAHHILT